MHHPCSRDAPGAWRSARYALSSLDMLVSELERSTELSIVLLESGEAPLSDDAAFVRRVFLDLLGRIPTREDRDRFLGKGVRNNLILEISHLPQETPQ